MNFTWVRSRSFTGAAAAGCGAVSWGVVAAGLGAWTALTGVFETAGAAAFAGFCAVALSARSVSAAMGLVAGTGVTIVAAAGTLTSGWVSAVSGRRSHQEMASPISITTTTTVARREERSRARGLMPMPAVWGTAATSTGARGLFWVWS